MEINDYSLKHNRLHKLATSEYEASQAKTQQLNPSKQDQMPAAIKGEIIDLRYQEVTIRLEPSGQIITANVLGDLPLYIGQKAEFLIADDTKGQITLRYIESLSTPMYDIAHKALFASGLAVSERNLAIVKELLNYQMPVDKKTILKMIKLTGSYPDTEIKNLVLMLKKQLPITPNNIAQFEAYQMGRHQIITELNKLINNISLTLNNAANNTPNIENYNQLSPSTTDMSSNNPLTDNIDITNFNNKAAIFNEKYIDIISLNKELLSILKADENSPATYDTSIKDTMSDKELIKVQEAISDILEEAKILNANYINIDLYKSQISDGSITLGNFLSLIRDLLPTNNDKLIKFIKSDTYQELISEAFHNRWTLSPKEILKEKKVNRYFDSLYDDLKQLKKIADKLPQADNIKEPINKLQDNLQFMRDLNDLFLYLQLPLRLTDQDVHADLYVFSRKNKKHLDNEQLSILLHLDMANLGPMDVHMTIQKRIINMVIYLEKSSQELISQHLNELQDKILQKGYQLLVKTKVSDKKPDFITDILQDDTLNQGLYRYSFDIRA